MDNKLIFIKKWEPNLRLERDMLGSHLVWIRLKNLYLSLWNSRGISKIASLVNNPLIMDYCTRNVKRLQYARVLVDIKAWNKLKHQLRVKDRKGNVYIQDIEYQYVPPDVKTTSVLDTLMPTVRWWCNLSN